MAIRWIKSRLEVWKALPPHARQFGFDDVTGVAYIAAALDEAQESIVLAAARSEGVEPVYDPDDAGRRPYLPIRWVGRHAPGTPFPLAPLEDRIKWAFGWHGEAGAPVAGYGKGEAP